MKIRGFRIEPAEIEAAIGALPGVREAVVLAREDRGEKRLVAWVVPEREGAVAVPALRQALRERLPAYMVPAGFVLLERLPLTPNGKVDRRALPAPAPETGPDARATAPANDLEEWIAAVWREVLGIERINALDNFFDLGGHSLLATRIASRLGRALGAAPPVRWIFEQPTVRGLAARIAAARPAAGEDDPPIVRLPRGAGGELPLSFSQQRLWWLDLLEPGSNWYNVAVALRLEGELDLPALAAALTAIVRRHEPLRTTFPAAAGQPRQEIAAEPPDGLLRTADLTALPHGVREAAAGAQAAEEARRPFDLAAGPLLRCLLLRLDEREHVLSLTAHHIVCDAWSIGLFVRELTALYHAAVRGERPTLPELPVQYADFAAWQRRRLTGERADRLVGEWGGRLAGVPAAIELPIDRPHPPLQTFRGGKVPFLLGAPATAGLRALARAEAASLFMTLLAGFQALLHRYSGQDDVVVGTPVAGRNRPEVEDLIGVFINTLALRGRLDGEPTFRALLGRTCDAALTAYALQDLPFERLVEELQPVRDRARSPLFQVMLILQNAPLDPLALQGVTWTPLPVDSGTAKMELLLSVAESRGELAGQLEYNAGLFDRTTARRLAGHLEALLTGAAADPDVCLADLPLLPAAERQQILREWNDTAAEVPALPVHRLIARQTARAPHAPAVADAGSRLSYGELDARANRLAHRLRRLGVGPEVLVGVSLERSADMMAALLGILKAGGAYLPLDPSYPEDRLRFMLEDSGARFLVATEKPGALPGSDLHGLRVLFLDDPSIGEESPHAPSEGCELDDPSQLAYVLYTSGSTGRPKGVEVTHGALANFLAGMRQCPGLEAADVLLATTSLSFDIAGLELYLPLLAGARLVIARRDEVNDGGRLGELLAEHGATVMQGTPATWRMMVESGWRGGSGLKVLCGGDALPADLAVQLQTRAAEVWSLYGPTETTVWSAVERLAAERPVAIGRPIANTEIYVAGSGLETAPAGVPGELLIGGAGVARGYLGRPDLTAERFIPDPWSRVPGTRLYRTGDLARYRPDGRLEHLGRADLQVKIRGFRIEPAEIEAALGALPGVREAVVLAREDRGEKRLVAWVVPEREGAVAVPVLRQALRERLPVYMVPADFVLLERLPLTPNGKIDRRALPAPDRTTFADAAAGPGSPVEELLAGIWAEVLGVERVGIEDDFFALGGHSILATVLMYRVRQELGVDLPLRTLFVAPTVAGLAAAVASVQGEQRTLPARLPRIAPDAADSSQQYQPFPLTDVQEAYWIGRRAGMELGSVATHSYFEVDIPGLDVDRFERALRLLVDRHGMLRAIVEPDGRQRILAEVPPYVLARLDLRTVAAETATEALEAVRERMSHQVLPADRWPLFEIAASLLPANHERENRVRLHVSLDLLIGDAWSLRLLARDLDRLYDHPGSPLPRLEVSFRDYVLAEAALRETEAWQRALEYWRGRLADFPPPPALPLAKSPSAVGVPRFVRRRGELPAADWTRLKERAAAAGLTPSGVLLAAWSEVLAAWSGSSRFTLNLTLFNRLPLHPQVDQLVGDFTSLTLLAVERHSGEPFVEGARRLQQRLWDDLDHRLVSGVRVLRELSRLRREPRTIMPVVFTSTLTQASRETAAQAGSGLRTEGGFAISQTPQVWLDHQVTEQGGALVWSWDAVEELFPAGLLDAMLGAYTRLLERLAADENSWREPARGLVPSEQLRLIAEVNATAAPVPAGLLHEPFLEQARRAPGAPAVITSSRTLTYRELDRLSLAFAHRLRRLGAGPNRLVAVVMHKGWEQVAAVLAVLRAGAAYLPVDARLPAERLRHLLVRGEVTVALTQPGLEGTLDWPDGVERVVVGEDFKDGNDKEIEIEAGAAAGDLAYAIFTSGSTGEPKGVMIDHRGAGNTVIDVNRRFGVGPDDRVLALSSLSFDLSVWDVFGVLAAGGALVVPDAGSERDPACWAEIAERERVTVWNTVPALIEMLVEHGAGRPEALAAPLRLVLLSGDWVPVRLPDRIRSAFPGAQVISLGGATEASIWSILFPVGKIGAEWTSIPYGRAMANQSFHVLDDDLEPCPVWVPGHLWIGGIGLARGYWRDEEKTGAAFLVHPRSGERLYRTGDLGRLLPGGDIEFLGRDDTQVKVQGHRIELGEIEAALARHPAVAAAVVAAVGERSGPKQLVAYVVPQPAEVISATAARTAVLTDPMQRLRFKLAHPGLRPDEERPAVELERPELPPEQIETLYLRRRSFRSFLGEPVPLNDLARLLSCLLPVEIAGAPFPKHRYGSAGNVYPVQTYLHVKAGRVDGLAGGVYYHDPRRHRLVLISSEDHLDASLWDATNRAVFEEAAFAVFLIARLAAIAPLYGERARHFATLEAGLMTQLLETAAPDHRIGLAQMGGLRFEAVRRRFALDESCELVHTLLGGRIDAAQTGLAAFLAEMAEQQALVRLVEEHPEEIAAAAQPVPRSDADLFKALREHLRSRLPEPLVPALWVRLDALPLSANGKVDRKALPPPEAAPAEARPAAAWAPPETATEQALASLVAEVLGVARVGLHDSFFDLGASSVHIVRVHNALRERLGTEIPIVEMFNHPSVSHLARRLAPEAPASDPVAEPEEELREGRDWRRQRLEKLLAAGDL